MDSLKLKAQIYQIRTTVDGGARITLDTNEKDMAKVAALFLLKNKLFDVELKLSENMDSLEEIFNEQNGQTMHGPGRGTDNEIGSD